MSRRGFSLIELMVVVGIFSILAFGILTLLQNGLTSSATVERNANVAEDVNEIRRILAKSAVCTPNFTGKIVPVGGDLVPDLPITVLNYYNQTTGAIEGKLAEVNIPKAGLVITSMGIKMRQRITDHSAVVNLNIRYKGTKDSWGTFDIRRTIPLFVTTGVGNDTIISCSDLGEDGPTLYEKICAIASENRDYYNPGTSKCESRFEQRCMGSGDSQVASCVTGWTVINNKWLTELIPEQCVSIPPAGFVDTEADAKSVTAGYSKGKSQKSYPSAAFCDADAATGSAECYYRDGIPPTGWQCQVCCERQVIF